MSNTQGKLLDWLKKRRVNKCPDCGFKVPHSLVQTTAWCPECDKIWRLRRNTWSWKYFWYYIKAEDVKGQIK